MAPGDDTGPPADDTDYDKLIREGLQILTRINGAVLGSALPLVLLEGLNLSQLATALQMFGVEADADHAYNGLMSQGQHDYLMDHTDSLEELSHAVSRVVGNVYNQISQALGALHKAWDAPPALPAPELGNGGGGVPVPTCCCVIDGQTYYGMPSSDCTALQGQFHDPCMGARPATKPKTAARRRGR